MDKVEAIPHVHQWFTTSSMQVGQSRCFNCGMWSQEFDAQAAELAAQKEQMRVLEEEMLVLGDERLCATLDAKENMEIANEFKKLMEHYRQHAEAAYKQSHKLEEEFKQYRKDHCGCLLKECPDCFETEMK